MFETVKLEAERFRTVEFEKVELLPVVLMLVNVPILVLEKLALLPVYVVLVMVLAVNEPVFIAVAPKVVTVMFDAFILELVTSVSF
jgi:hypothetical protein